MTLSLPESLKSLFTVKTVDHFRLWEIDLELPLPPEIEAIPLSEAESERAARFFKPTDSHRFLQRRRLVRYLLGAALQTPPETITFQLGANGKPELAAPHRTLFFNTSHSDNLFLMAIGHTPVGVDIEKINLTVDIPAIRNCFLSAQEKLWLENFATSEADFFHLWTMKEAYLKAQGLGIAAFRKAEVVPDENREMHRAPWTVRLLPTQAGFAAAISFKAHK